MIILAIDPGTTNIGYCIYDATNKNIITTSTIISPQKNFEDKLLNIYNSFKLIIDEYNPQLFIYEKPVFANRGTISSEINQALGIIIALFKLQNNKLQNNIHFYSAKQIKKLVTGNGLADKKDVADKVARYFNIENNFATNHSSDSVAVLASYLIERNKVDDVVAA
jgi:crossover junction endodeoxyribonuclease RuvC